MWNKCVWGCPCNIIDKEYAYVVFVNIFFQLFSLSNEMTLLSSLKKNKESINQIVQTHSACENLLVLFWWTRDAMGFNDTMHYVSQWLERVLYTQCISHVWFHKVNDTWFQIRKLWWGIAHSTIRTRADQYYTPILSLSCKPNLCPVHCNRPCMTLTIGHALMAGLFSFS